MESKMLRFDIAKSQLSEAIQNAYDALKKLIKAHGGLLYTQRDDCTPMCAVHYLSYDVPDLAECQICGIRVKDEDLQIYTVPEMRNVKITVSMEDLTDPEQEDAWESIKYDDIAYSQTLVSIMDSIKEYLV